MSNVTKIHIHSIVDQRTVDYLNQMWRTALDLSNHPNLLELTAHCIDGRAPELVKHRLDVGNVNVRCVPRPIWMGANETMSGSSGHAACVENALAETGDGDIHIICDSDTVLLAKGWDDAIRLKLIDGDIGTLGVTYENVGGFSSGNTLNRTYKNIPNVVWMALSPKHSWRNLQVRPRKSVHIPIVTDADARTYNLPIGFQVFCDVGWQIPGYLRDHNISYVGLEQLKPTKNAIVLKGLTDYHEEYHLDNVPFVVHHRGSMKHAFRGAGTSKSFFDVVDAYLALERTLRPRWTL